MTFAISSGMPEDQLPAWLSAAADKHGTFADGRINYRHAKEAPAVMCTVVCGDEILLLRRSNNVGDAKGRWSIVSGYIDADRSVAALAQTELSEETGIQVDTKDIQVGKSYRLTATPEARDFILFPCLLQLTSKPEVTLNPEHTDFAWVKRSDIGQYQTLPDLSYAIDAALRLASTTAQD